MMSHDLEEFESALKSRYGHYWEFKPSKKIQSLVTYLKLSHLELEKVLQPPLYIAHKNGFLQSGSIFNSNVYIFGINGIERIFYIYCEDLTTLSPAIYVVGFPAGRETAIYNTLKRIENLKAFL